MLIKYEITRIGFGILGAFFLFREVLIAQKVENERAKLEDLKVELKKILLYEKDPAEWSIQELMMLFEIHREEAKQMYEDAINSQTPLIKETLEEVTNTMKNLGNTIKQIKQIEKYLAKTSADKMKQRRFLLMSGIVFITASAGIDLYLHLE